MKLSIKNFQSIEYQEFEFNNFSILIGSSNLGKSAIVRALRAVLYNEFDKSYIRFGEDTTNISLELNTNISKIEYTRSYKKSINEYKVYYSDGKIEILDKVGIESIQPLKDLGFKYLELDRSNDKINTNFQSQLEGLFLFNSSDVIISSFFNKVFNVDKYENALRECNKDITQFTKDYNLAIETNTSIDSQLNDAKIINEDLKIKYDNILNIKNKFDSLLNIKNKIDLLKIHTSTIHTLNSDLSNIKSIKNYLNKSNSLLNKIVLINTYSTKCIQYDKFKNNITYIDLINLKYTDFLISLNKVFKLKSFKTICIKYNTENTRNMNTKIILKKIITSSKTLINIVYIKNIIHVNSKYLTTKSKLVYTNTLLHSYSKFKINLQKINTIFKLASFYINLQSLKDSIKSYNIKDELNRILLHNNRLCDKCGNICAC